MSSSSSQNSSSPVDKQSISPATAESLSAAVRNSLQINGSPSPLTSPSPDAGLTPRNVSSSTLTAALKAAADSDNPDNPDSPDGTDGGHRTLLATGASQFNRRPLSDTPLLSPKSGTELPAMGRGLAPLNTAAATATTPGGQDSGPASGSVSRIDSPRSTASGVPPLPRRGATTLDVPGLTRSKISPDGMIAARDIESKLVIVMVGLPARGKSYVTKKLSRYLNWQQHGAKIFNVGNTRRNADRRVGPASAPLPDAIKGDKHNFEELAHDLSHSGHPDETHPDHPEHGVDSADFFSPDNSNTFQLREKWAIDTLDQLLDYILFENGSVGILDATNTTKARRQKVLQRIRERTGGRLKVLFLESICTRSEIIDANIRLKLSGPDYKDMDREAALKDFVARLHNYEKVYETVTEEEEQDDNFQYIKMIDVGRKVVCYNIQGFLAGQAVFFLLNFNLSERQIWITRHGESEDNAAGKIGGDAPLTERGHKFARALSRFMDFQKGEFRKKQLQSFSDRVRILKKEGSAPTTPFSEPEEPNFCVWTSMMQRSIQTAEYVDEEIFAIKEMRMLNELGAGMCEGMTYEQIMKKYPQEYSARIADKIQYRYPGIGGESYLDVINRLRPVIVEMERMEDNALIICHRVVARVLLSYFMNLGRDSIGDLDVPLHTLYMLEPKPYGVDWAVYEYNEETDWFYRVPKETISSQIEKLQQDKKDRLKQPVVQGLGSSGLGPATRTFSVVPTSENAPQFSGRDRPEGSERAPIVPTRSQQRRPSAVDDIQLKEAAFKDWETHKKSTAA